MSAADNEEEGGEEGGDEDNAMIVAPQSTSFQIHTAEEIEQRKKILDEIDNGNLSFPEKAAKWRELLFIDYGSIARVVLAAVNQWVQMLGGGKTAPARLKLSFAPTCCDALREWEGPEDFLLSTRFQQEYPSFNEITKHSASRYTEGIMKHFLGKVNWKEFAAKSIPTRSFVECRARFWFKSWVESPNGSKVLRERRDRAEEKRMLYLIERQGEKYTDWPLIAKQLGRNRTPGWCMERFMSLKMMRGNHPVKTKAKTDVEEAEADPEAEEDSEEDSAMHEEEEE